MDIDIYRNERGGCAKGLKAANARRAWPGYVRGKKPKLLALSFEAVCLDYVLRKSF
jgi:hypothetical protein